MITVLTPTYNRAYILGNLKESLLRQTNDDFEWLIIDDGSTDDTKKLVQSWISQEETLKIRYFYRENGGKHRALNYGIPLAEGDFVFIVDSDDRLTEDAIERVTSWIETMEEDDSIVAVAGLRGYPDGKRIGEFPDKKTYVDVKNSHRYVHHLTGDKAEIYRKSALVAHPFPEFEGERFIGEGSVWNQLALEGYKVRWFNQVIYIGQYLGDGLTSHQRLLNIRNFQGYTHNTRLNYRAIVFPYNLMAVAVYLGVAESLGYTGKWVKKEIGITSLGLLLCRLIRVLRRMS